MEKDQAFSNMASTTKYFLVANKKTLSNYSSFFLILQHSSIQIMWKNITEEFYAVKISKL